MRQMVTTKWDVYSIIGNSEYNGDYNFIQAFMCGIEETKKTVVDLNK